LQQYYVKGVVDLHGKTLDLPEKTTILFKNDSKIVNGTIRGNNTTIKNASDDCFGVILTRTWNVKEISDTWFDKKCLTDNDIIKSLDALQSDRIKQTLKIERDHCLELSSEFNTGLSIASNTKVILKAVLSIEGNALERYNIVSIVRKENVSLIGGEVRGDVGKHRYINGSTSEWGFGIYIYESSDIAVSDLKVSLCTGDGFYITGTGVQIGDYTGASKNIKLKRCIVNDNRREGFSLIHAEGVLIEDCKAINMGQTEYTPPSYGINIEPNKNNSVKNVLIERFSSENSYTDFSFSSGGYQFDGVKSNRENIILDRCSFDKGVAIMSGGVKVKNSSMRKVAIYTSNVPKGKDGDVVFNNCIVEGGYGIQFDGRKKMNDTSPFPRYYFNNCTITASGVYNPVPGLIWGTDLKNVMANLQFKNCDISLKPGLKGNTLMAKGLDIDCVFKKCKINLNGYVFTPMNNVFDRCTIECYSINESNDASFVKRTKIKIGQQ